MQPGPLGSGDVNGDGLADIVITAPPSVRDEKSDATSVYVIFGKRDSAPLDRLNLGAGGFAIPHAAADADGELVPDVNGDGLADVAVIHSDNRVAYVVFGKRDAGTVTLGRLGAAGLRVMGFPSGRLLDRVLPAGDVNGDGLADIAVSMFRGGSRVPLTDYVVLGRHGGGVVDVSRPSRGVIRVLTVRDATVYGAGDVDGDGFGDLLVGDPGLGDCVDFGCGVVWLATRVRRTAVVDARRPGPRTREITSVAHGNLGFVAPLGDVNGDRRDDFAMSGISDTDEESTLVVPRRLGHSRPLVMERLPTLLRVRDWEDYNAAGDVNGDGRADVALLDEDGQGRVLYGRGARVSVRVSRVLPPVGALALRPSPGAHFEGFEGAGDVNGDGLADFLACETLNAPPHAVRTFVVFGSREGATRDAESLGENGFEVQPTTVTLTVPCGDPNV
jgi:hypothetical protein